MEHIDPLIPGVRDRLDIALGWISEYRAQWEEKYVGVEVERLGVERLLLRAAEALEAMVHAPLEQRQSVCAAILTELRNEGYWPPEVAPVEEPTA